jgi:prevent-host-death family protein
MKTITVSKLKTSLSSCLNRVKAGDEVIVTERGKPIAKIVSIAPSGADTKKLREIEKKGLLTVGSGKLPKNFWSLPRPKDPKGLVLKADLDEREGGR